MQYFYELNVTCILIHLKAHVGNRIPAVIVYLKVKDKCNIHEFSCLQIIETFKNLSELKCKLF